jgi:hypothetical protein
MKPDLDGDDLPSRSAAEALSPQTPGTIRQSDLSQSLSGYAGAAVSVQDDFLSRRIRQHRIDWWCARIARRFQKLAVPAHGSKAK